MILNPWQSKGQEANVCWGHVGKNTILSKVFNSVSCRRIKDVQLEHYSASPLVGEGRDGLPASSLAIRSMARVQTKT